MRAMLQTLHALLAPAAAERLTLVINHVIGSEPVAMQRLQPHAGRTLMLALDGWPALLPSPPVLAWRITPAGLLEWCGAEFSAASDLQVRIDASNPAALLARAAAGERPAVQVQGDAALAGDANWLLENLRWDVAADLQRLFGPVVADGLQRLGSVLAGALKAAFSAASGLGDRFGARFGPRV